MTPQLLTRATRRLLNLARDDKLDIEIFSQHLHSDKWRAPRAAHSSCPPYPAVESACGADNQAIEGPTVTLERSWNLLVGLARYESGRLALSVDSWQPCDDLNSCCCWRLSIAHMVEDPHVASHSCARSGGLPIQMPGSTSGQGHLGHFRLLLGHISRALGCWGRVRSPPPRIDAITNMKFCLHQTVATTAEGMAGSSASAGLSSPGTRPRLALPMNPSRRAH